MIMAVLTRFVARRPRHVVSQRDSLDWLARAHAGAEAALANLDADGRAAFARKIARLLDRVACSPDSIATRASVLPDFVAGDRGDTVLYDTARWTSGLRRHPHGKGATARIEAFTRAVDAYF